MTLEQQLAPISKFKVSYTDFEKERSIGKGAYSEVFLATHTPTQINAALKVLTVNELQGTQMAYFIREVFILATIQNPFLVQFLGYTDTYPYCIVTQYVECGSLYDALNHNPSSPELSNTDKTNIAMCIAYGMISLHRLHIIHRDLKSLNILLDSNFLPKVIDFGISRFYTSKDELITTTIGTPHWMAPEMFNSSKYDEKVDVYSFGVLLWEMLTGITPFNGMTPFQIMNAVCQNAQRPPIPEDTPEELTSLIEACWAQEPKDRPSFEKVFQQFATHEVFFKGTDHEVVQSLVNFIAQYEQQMSPMPEELPPEIIEEPPEPPKPPKPPKPPQKTDQIRLDATSHTKIGLSPIPLARSDPRMHSASKHNSIQILSKAINEPLDTGDTNASYDLSDKIHNRPKCCSYKDNIPLNNVFSKTSPSLGHYIEISSAKKHKCFFIDTSKEHGKSHRSRSFRTTKITSSTTDDSFVASSVKSIDNPKAHGYKHRLKSAASKLTLDVSQSFFRSVASNLTTPNIPKGALLVTAQQLVKLCHRDPQFVIDMTEANCVASLPCRNPILTDLILSIFMHVAKECPGCVPLDGLRDLLEFAKGRERKFVFLLDMFYRTICDYTVFADIVHCYASKAHVFFESYEAVSFLGVLFSIYQKKPDFSFIPKLFMLALHSPEVSLLQAAYRAICNIAFNVKDLPLQHIFNHFDFLPFEVTSLIARMPHIPSRSHIVAGLIKSASSTPLASYLLCKLAENEKGAKLLLANRGWIVTGGIGVEHQLRIFLSLFTHKQLHAELIQLPNLIGMFFSVVEQAPPESLRAIVTVIRVLENEYPAFVASCMSETGFLASFFRQTLAKSSNVELALDGVLLLDKICRMGYVNVIEDVIGYVHNALEVSPKVCEAMLKVMIVMCQYEEALAAFRENRVPEEVRKMDVGTEKGESYRREFLCFFEN